MENQIKCYVCDTELNTKNESNEHIIINAAGGRLKSKKLLCKGCNSKFGDTIDNELAEQLKILSNIFNIRRQRGSNQPISGKTPSGQKYDVAPGGKPYLSNPKFSQKEQDGKKTITIEARNEKELKKMLSNLSKKNPDLDPDDAIKKAKKESKYLSEPIKISINIGGKGVLRAVCKCAVNYFIYCGGKSNQIKHLLPYINGTEESNIVNFHYAENLYTINPDECFHLLHIKGNSSDKLLYAFIEFFNAYKYIVLLNDNYIGPDLNRTYCFDIIKSGSITKTINTIYSYKQVTSLLAKPVDNFYKPISDYLSRSMKLGLEIQKDRHLEELTRNAIDKSFSKFKSGTLITKEMIDELSIEVAEAILPFLLRGDVE